MRINDIVYLVPQQMAPLPVKLKPEKYLVELQMKWNDGEESST